MFFAWSWAFREVRHFSFWSWLCGTQIWSLSLASRTLLGLKFWSILCHSHTEPYLSWSADWNGFWSRIFVWSAVKEPFIVAENRSCVSSAAVVSQFWSGCQYFGPRNLKFQRAPRPDRQQPAIQVFYCPMAIPCPSLTFILTDWLKICHLSECVTRNPSLVSCNFSESWSIWLECGSSLW